MGIDRDFKQNRKLAEEKPGYSIWGPVNGKELLGIHGTKVAVDFDICIGDGVCIDVCPVEVFEWLETPGHPASEKKADPVRESDCVFCNACETECPVEAIAINADN